MLLSIYLVIKASKTKQQKCWLGNLCFYIYLLCFLTEGDGTAIKMPAQWCLRTSEREEDAFRVTLEARGTGS